MLQKHKAIDSFVVSKEAFHFDIQLDGFCHRINDPMKWTQPWMLLPPPPSLSLMWSAKFKIAQCYAIECFLSRSCAFHQHVSWKASDILVKRFICLITLLKLLLLLAFKISCYSQLNEIVGTIEVFITTDC